MSKSSPSLTIPALPQKPEALVKKETDTILAAQGIKPKTLLGVAEKFTRTQLRKAASAVPNVEFSSIYSNKISAKDFEIYSAAFERGQEKTEQIKNHYNKTVEVTYTDFPNDDFDGMNHKIFGLKRDQLRITERHYKDLAAGNTPDEDQYKQSNAYRAFKKEIGAHSFSKTDKAATQYFDFLVVYNNLQVENEIYNNIMESDEAMRRYAEADSTHGLLGSLHALSTTLTENAKLADKYMGSPGKLAERLERRLMGRGNDISGEEQANAERFIRLCTLIAKNERGPSSAFTQYRLKMEEFKDVFEELEKAYLAKIKSGDIEFNSDAEKKVQIARVEDTGHQLSVALDERRENIAGAMKGYNDGDYEAVRQGYMGVLEKMYSTMKNTHAVMQEMKAAMPDIAQGPGGRGGALGSKTSGGGLFNLFGGGKKRP